MLMAMQDYFEMKKGPAIGWMPHDRPISYPIFCSMLFGCDCLRCCVISLPIPIDLPVLQGKVGIPNYHEHKVSRKENATNLVIVGRMVGQAIDLISIDSFDWFISAAGVRNRWKTKHYW